MRRDERGRFMAGEVPYSEAAWRAANRERVLEYSRAYRRRNPDAHREWRARNPDKVRAISARDYRKNRLAEKVARMFKFSRAEAREWLREHGG